MKVYWLNTSDDFKAMIIGKLLGDGSITKQEGRRPRFKFMHVHTDFAWCNHCYYKLCTHIPLSKPTFKKTMDSRLSKGYSLAYYVQSKVSPIICYLREKWYPDGGKIIPYDLIEKHFSEISLAWWYMDDGHLKQKNNTPQKIILSTDNFTIDENFWMTQFLKQKYKLHFTLDRQNRLILYDQYQIFYFLHLVMPFMQPSMYRKFLSFSSLKNDLEARRTTIYLPIDIKLAAPTAQINEVLSYLNRLIDRFKNGLFYNDIVNRGSEKSKGYQIMIAHENLSN